jgi:galactose mutarotase-like enzyme
MHSPAMSELPAVILRDPSSALAATYVPDAGMICTSLAADGIEFLGQRRGLTAYLTAGKTMGIPILYPWANRLSANDYDVAGGSVTLRPGVGGVRSDPNGLPIHGLLGAYRGWRVISQTVNRLTAEVDFGSEPGLLASFPFPHTVQLDAELSERTLTVSTTVTATAAVAVPLCFGFHPYLTLPGVPRSAWILETPPLRHLLVDGKGIPTGADEIWPESAEPLGDRGFDDGFDQVPDGAAFVLRGGGRRIEVTYMQGYPAAQIFAPVAEDLIAIEPMAAPTNALRTGAYQVATPGQPATAVFSIRVL